MQIDLFRPAEQVRNAGSLKMCQVIIPNAIGNEQNNVITFNLILLKAQDTFCVCANRQSFYVFVRDMVTASD